jgi:hypothetical protein
VWCSFIYRVYIKFENFAKICVSVKTVAVLQMNLKSKLYILENPTLLLFGPSPFEHWFKSY